MKNSLGTSCVALVLVWWLMLLLPLMGFSQDPGNDPAIQDEKKENGKPDPCEQLADVPGNAYECRCRSCHLRV